MSAAAPIPPNRVNALVAAALRKRERVLWRGRPVPRYAAWSSVSGDTWLSRGPLLLLALLVVLVFSLPGAAFAHACGRNLLDPSGPGGFLLSLALLPPSLAAAAFPAWWVTRPVARAYRNAKDIHYVITDQRALVLLIRNGEVEDGYHKDLYRITRSRVKRLRWDGAGDVIYDTGGELASDAGSSPYTLLYDIGFQGVPDAERVHALLLTAIRDCPRNRGSRRAAQTRHEPA